MSECYSTYFVMGSTSFAGSWFVKGALERGIKVVSIGRSPSVNDIFLPYKKNGNLQLFSYQQMDINRNSEDIVAMIKKIQPEVIVDFAAQSMVAQSWNWPEQWYQTNVVAKARLQNALIKMPFLKRYIRISTPEVYGHTEELSVEHTRYNPSTPYAISQAAIDMHLMACFQQYGFPVVFTRFANFYGSGQQLYRIVPRAIFCALVREILPLHGGGISTRAFIHGHDVSDGILRVIEKGELGQIYHFSTDEFVTIRELVEKIAKKCQLELEDFVEIAPERPGKDTAYLMNSDKAKKELGWHPRYDLNSGLEETLQWVRGNLDTIRDMPKEYIHRE